MLKGFLRSRRQRHVRAIMRGYRTLKASGQLNRIALLKQELTTIVLEEIERHTSRLIFGAGVANGELIVRQYLLARVAGVNLNEALLHSIGDGRVPVAHPLPRQWQVIVRNHGFDVAGIKSTCAWYGLVSLHLFYGIFLCLRRLCESVRAMPRSGRNSLGAYAYFDTLGAGNLPQRATDGRSHDIISWYMQWPDRVQNLNALCHGVRTAQPACVDAVMVKAISSAIPPLTRLASVARYASWSAAAITLSLVDVLRGRWWHALLLSEASSGALVRMHDAVSLARDYLFHNSGWIYRRLWTYEAEARGSRILFYFYSTNCESFKQPAGYPQPTYGWRAMNWSRYLVWDEPQAEFVRRAVGDAANVQVVGPIWFQTSSAELCELAAASVAVFDVQPMRDARYQTLGLDYEYYTPRTAVQFLRDVYEVVAGCKVTMAFKRKRHIGYLAHPRYRHFLERFDELPNVVTVDPDISAVRVIEKSIAVISMPFTSTALMGRQLGKPSVYYDPHGLCQKDDRAAHGIEILTGKDELRSWLTTVTHTPARSVSAADAVLGQSVMKPSIANACVPSRHARQAK